MKGLLMLAPEASGVGRQLIAEVHEESRSEVLAAVIGTRSPSTVVKRVNSLLHFYRWHMVTFEDRDVFPLYEPSVWEYIRHLHFTQAAPTKATSFIQALRFSAFVLQIEGADECIKSRRLVGSAELQLALKRPTRQARPLTVLEMKKLHVVMEDESLDLRQRVLCSHLLMMVYTRSRTSDLSHVAEVLHDAARDRENGNEHSYVQVLARFHKAARSVETKNLLLPILASSAGVSHGDWIATWMRLRRKAGLPIAGKINGAPQPAPDLRDAKQDVIAWLQRPLGCLETTLLLRQILQCEDERLTSHAMKVTGLSWCAKAEVPREQRRLLGRHASSLKEADSVYSRDLAFAPVRSFSRVIVMIRDGLFDPDQPRSMYFKGDNPMVPGTPMPMFNPKTPAFLSKDSRKERVPATPPFDHQSQEDANNESSVQVEAVCAVKEEQAVQGDLRPPVEEAIEIVSSSDSTTSTSNVEDQISDEEYEDEVEKVHANSLPSQDSSSCDVLIKNSKTGVIHRIPGVDPAELNASGSQYVNSEKMQKMITKCGRLTQKGFVLIKEITDWPDKCRVCFKGCRAPTPKV